MEASSCAQARRGARARVPSSIRVSLATGAASAHRRLAGGAGRAEATPLLVAGKWPLAGDEGGGGLLTCRTLGTALGPAALVLGVRAEARPLHHLVTDEGGEGVHAFAGAVGGVCGSG